MMRIHEFFFRTEKAREIQKSARVPAKILDGKVTKKKR